MQSKHITKGNQYAMIDWPSLSMSVYSERAADYYERVTVLAEPKNGIVKVKTHPGRGRTSRTTTVSVRNIAATWEEFTAIRDARDAERQEVIDSYTRGDADLRALLGDRFEDFETYVDFEVENDGSFSGRVNMPRSTFYDLVAAIRASVEQPASDPDFTHESDYVGECNDLCTNDGNHMFTEDHHPWA